MKATLFLTCGLCLEHVIFVKKLHLSQAKDYGSCVTSKVHEVEKDMCLKEFLALKNCMQHTVIMEFLARDCVFDHFIFINLD